MAFVSHLREYGIHVDLSIHGLLMPFLLFSGSIQGLVCNRAFRLGRDLRAMVVLDMGRDVPGRQYIGAHRDDLVLEPGFILLALLDNYFRLKIALPIPRGPPDKPRQI